MTTDASQQSADAPVYTQAQFDAELARRTQEAVSGATSRVQSELAATQKRVEGLMAERDAALQDSSRLTAEVETLRAIEGLDGDAAKFAAYKANETANLRAERERLNQDGRNVQIERLLSEFDGSRAELEAFGTPYEMEIHALRNWQRKGAPPATGQTPQGAENGTPPAPQAGSEPGVGQMGTPTATPQPDHGAAAGAGTGAPPAGLKGADKIAAGLAARGDTPGI